MNRCILCSSELDVCNASEICRECILIVANLLDARIDDRWRPVAVVGADNVIVSDRGQVARLLGVDYSHRYPRCSIAGRKYYVHTLVCEGFNGPRPDGHLVLHHDDDPMNPDAGNLRFGSRADNAADRRRNHRKEHR
jgi:hypothetical protein